MRKWKVLVAILAAATVVPTAFAQNPGSSTQEDILREIQALKSRVASLEVENSELKGTVAEQSDVDLELQINALTDRLVAGTTVKSAANPVTLTGEFRFRNTWSLGDYVVGDGDHDGSWTDSLIRLGFMYEFTRDVVGFAEVQSHWAAGNGSSSDAFNGFVGIPSNDNSSNTPVYLYQGWLEVRNILNKPEFSSRTGRQEVVLGNQFQFGNADWYNGWTFDGSRWDWDSEAFSITALVMKMSSNDGDLNQVSSFLARHDDDELYSVYFTLKTIKNNELDLYWIYMNGHGGAGTGSGSSGGALGNSVGGFTGATSYFHTIGGRLGGVLPDVAAGLDYNVEFAYQFGNSNLPAGFGEVDVEGFALEAELGITFNKDSMFRLFGRFLWASGPDNDQTGYVPLYTNRHSNGGFRARYGIFDLIPLTNVLTVQVGASFDPDPAWTIGATALWATTDEDFGPIQDDYGWEIDAWGEYRYSENLVFGAGVAFLFPDDAGEATWGTDDDSQFLGYIQARLLF